MTVAPHTQVDADLSAGMGMPDNGPKLMSMQIFSLVWEARYIQCNATAKFMQGDLLLDFIEFVLVYLVFVLHGQLPRFMHLVP